MYATDPDAQLLERWRTSRNPDAFAELVTRHGPLVYSTCLRVLRNPPAAEDAAQECFLELLHSDTRVLSVPAWLHTAATRRALDRLKADRRRRERESSYAATRSPQVDPDVDDIRAYIDEAIETLPEKLRRPVVLRFFQDRTYAEISTELSLPTSTIQYRLKKGIEGARDHLARGGISVTATSLAVLIAPAQAPAFPTAVTAHLRKLALARPGAAGISSATGLQDAAATGGFLAGHKLAAAAALSIAALLAGMYVTTQEVPAWIAEAVNSPGPAASEEDADPLSYLELAAWVVSLPRGGDPVIRTARPSVNASVYVSGVIVDDHQNGVPGALVEATWAGGSKSIITNAEGRFRFAFLTDFTSDGPLVFRRSAYDEGRTTTVTFRGQVVGDTLSGTIETAQGNRSVTGERAGKGSGAIGVWYTVVERDDERFSGILTISRDRSGDVIGRWSDEYGPPEITGLGVPKTVTLSAALDAHKAFPQPFDIPATGRKDIVLAMDVTSIPGGSVIDSAASP